MEGKHTSKKVFKLISIAIKHTRLDSLKGQIPWKKKSKRKIEREKEREKEKNFERKSAREKNKEREKGRNEGRISYAPSVQRSSNEVLTGDLSNPQTVAGKSFTIIHFHVFAPNDKKV